MFDRLVVAIGVNPDKSCAFTLDERLEMLRKSTRIFSNVRVAHFNHEFLIRYAESIRADHILRGIRSESDYEYERVMRNINGDLNSKITTVFLMPPRDISEVSSSMVKGLIGPDGWQRIVRNYVPAAVYRELIVKFNARRSKDKVG